MPGNDPQTPSAALPEGVETVETPPEAAHARSNLFGRGLLYVVVWSMQTLAAIVVSPVLAYVMGPAQFGRLASAIALHQVLIVLAVLGLDQALVLQRGEDGTDRSSRGLVAVSLALASVLTLVVGLTGPLWAPQLGFGGYSSLVLATTLWTAPGAAVQVMLALLLSEDRLRPFALVSVLSAVGGQVIGVGLMLGIHRDAATYAWGGVVSQFGAMAVGIALTRPLLSGLRNRRVAGRAIRLGLPLTVTALASFVLNAGDRVIIQRILGAAEVGRYQVAYTVGYVVVLLLVFTSQAWAPRFAAARDEVSRLDLIGRSRNELYRILLPMTLGVTLIAPAALRVVAPASFRPDSLLVVVLLVALAGFPVAAAGASGRALIILRRGRSLAVIAIISAIANVLLNIVLIPPFGIAGSAGATVLSFAAQAFLQWRAVPSEPPWPRTPLRLWWSIGATCAVSELSVLLPQTPAWTTLRAAVAVFVCLPWLVMRLRLARRGEEAAVGTPVSAPAIAVPAVPAMQDSMFEASPGAQGDLDDR